MAKDIVLNNIDKTIQMIATGITNPSGGGSTPPAGETVATINIDVKANDGQTTLPDVSLGYVVRVFVEGFHTARINGPIEGMDRIECKNSEGSLTLIPNNGRYEILDYTGTWYLGGLTLSLDAERTQRTVNSAFYNGYDILMKQPSNPLPFVYDETASDLYPAVRPEFFDLNAQNFVYIQGADTNSNDEATPITPVINGFCQFGVKFNGDFNPDYGMTTIMDCEGVSDADNSRDVEIQFRPADNGYPTGAKFVLTCYDDDIGTNILTSFDFYHDRTDYFDFTIISAKDDTNSQWVVKVYMNGELKATENIPYSTFTSTNFFASQMNTQANGNIELKYFNICNSECSYIPTGRKQLIFD